MFNLACLLVAGVASVVAAWMGEWVVAGACVFSTFGWAFCFHWWREWRILKTARLWGWSRGPDSRHQLADDLERALGELRPLIAWDGVVGEEPPPGATNVGPDIVRSVVKRLRQTRPRQKSDELLNVE